MKRTKEKLNWLNLDKLKKSPDFVKHKTINVSKYSLVLQNSFSRSIADFPEKVLFQSLHGHFCENILSKRYRPAYIPRV